MGWFETFEQWVKGPEGDPDYTEQKRKRSAPEPKPPTYSVVRVRLTPNGLVEEALLHLQFEDAAHEVAEAWREGEEVLTDYMVRQS